MCGIAGFSIHPDLEVDTSMLVRMFIAGLAERGEDACGFAWSDGVSPPTVVKQASPPHEFLSSVPIAVPSTARSAIVHVRDHTKGRPSHQGNNHPIRHGRIVGVHNGVIQNDDELFAQVGRERALPGMSVDSEAIFMALDVAETHAAAFPMLVGSYAVAFYDDSLPRTLQVVRGRARPLVCCSGEGFTVFASTRHAIDFATTAVGLVIDQARDVPCGRLLTLADGVVQHTSRIRVRRFSELPTMQYSPDHPNAALARQRALGHGRDDEAQSA